MLSREAWVTLVIGLVAGGLLSIPIGLGTGLMFPSVQRWFDAKMKVRAFKKSSRTRKEYEEALYFVTYPHKMTHYFLNRGLELVRTALILLVLMGWAAVYSGGGGGSTQVGRWSFLAVLLAWFSNAFLIWVITQNVNRLHAIYLRVEFWGEYRKQVALELPDIDTAPPTAPTV